MLENMIYQPELSAPVVDLYATLGALRVRPAQFAAATGLGMRQFIGTSGLYHPRPDIIHVGGLTPKMTCEWDNTALHELVHWSGRSNRLRRGIICAMELANIPRTSEIVPYAHTEEMTAEVGALLLSVALGLGPNEIHIDKFEKHASYYKLANFDLAFSQAIAAVDFIAQKAGLSDLPHTAYNFLESYQSSLSAPGSLVAA